MEVPLLILLLLSVANLLQGTPAVISQDEKSAIKERLRLINKPAIKSFKTKHGDILDCVEIDKQLAFDNPLLKNHSIQIVPNITKSKWTRSNDNSSSVLTLSQLLPKNIKCPNGTVLIKRVQEKDLVMEKFAPFFGKMFSTSSNSSKFVYPNNTQPLEGDHVASLVLHVRNFGVYGSINIWTPEVKPDQLSSAFVFVASDDGSVNNGIAAGWAVINYLDDNYQSALFTYWTKDSSRSTGCFNTLCPGFVQTSSEIPLGIVFSPVSTYGGDQYELHISIEQDTTTKNWCLYFADQGVGYWPKELFSTLTDAAARGGWGGEVYSPVTEPTPPMGSGHFPDEGFAKACFIKELQYLDSSLSPTFPVRVELNVLLSNRDCYNVLYEEDDEEWGDYIFFGGPPNCKL